MTNKNIRHLGSLNPQNFFCPCGQGENGKCPAFHGETIRSSGPDVRAVAIIVGIVLMGAAVVAFGLFMAANI